MPENNGVLARIEFRAKGEADESTDPLWLSEAWFSESASRPTAADLQAEMQLLLPWERAVRWLDERQLPDKLVERARFQPIGSSYLSPRE
jgi:hypothetical protein